MKKRYLILLCILTTFTQCFFGVNAQDTNKLNLSSSSAVIMDATNKRILYNYNGDQQHYPASITKVMTMLLGIESGNLDRTATISEYGAMSIEAGSSHISLQPNESLSMKEAILATSLASANDGANMIAENVSGDIATFVKLMNERAKEIGCTNTNFVNAHGLHDDNHYTTAIDMAKIMSEAVNNDTYVELTGTLKYQIAPTEKTDVTRYLYTKNRCMVEDNEYYIPEVKSAKLGYTTKSLNNYVAYGKKGDVELVVCIMKVSNAEGLYTDLQKLFNYGFENYTTYNDLNKKIKLPDIDKSLFTVGGDLALSSPFKNPACSSEEKNNFDFIYNIDEEKAKNAKENEIIGTASLTYNGEVLESRDIVIVKPLKNVMSLGINLLWTLIKVIIILIIVAIGLLLLSKKIYTKYKNDQIRRRRQNRR